MVKQMLFQEFAICYKMFTIKNKVQDFIKKTKGKKALIIRWSYCFHERKEGLIVGATIYMETIWERGLGKESSTKE
jgi:hypothetical protein